MSVLCNVRITFVFNDLFPGGSMRVVTGSEFENIVKHIAQTCVNNKYVLQQTSKTLRQRLRNHLNHTYNKIIYNINKLTYLIWVYSSFQSFLFYNILYFWIYINYISKNVNELSFKKLIITVTNWLTKYIILHYSN